MHLIVALMPFGLDQPGHVHERGHDAVELSGLRPIGPQADQIVERRIPIVAPGGDLPFARFSTGGRTHQVDLEFRVIQSM